MILYVHYADYPTVRVIVRHGWRLINLCAPLDGLTFFLP